MNRDKNGKFIKGHIPVNKGKRIAEYIISVCKVCGVKIEYLKCIRYKKYCSRKCMYLGRPKHGKLTKDQKRKIGISNSIFWKTGDNIKKFPRYIDGRSYKPYGKWFKPLREEIRKRDNYECKLCFKKQNGEKLAIHHVNYEKSNYKNNNLISLCRSCHAKTNVKRDYWEKYFITKMESIL